MKQDIGAFGFSIGRKKRIMLVHHHADLMWQVLVREIYVLLKHFGSKEAMQKAFENIIQVNAKDIPTSRQKQHLRIYTNCEQYSETLSWPSLLFYCQGSYINVLEAGYILKQESNPVFHGFLFMIDFIKGTATFSKQNGSNIIQTASFEEIVAFDEKEMPNKTYTEIVLHMRTLFTEFEEKQAKIEEELQNMRQLLDVAKSQQAVNIEDKVQKRMDDVLWEKKRLLENRRVFYHRLQDLDLLEEEEKEEEE